MARNVTYDNNFAKEHSQMPYWVYLVFMARNVTYDNNFAKEHSQMPSLKAVYEGTRLGVITT
jgi:hypothetical protein